MPTKSLRPPLFLGLSLPMEPNTAVSASNDCSSMSSFPCFSRSKDIQNLPLHLVPDRSSIQRHKLMLDSIATRARALTGNRGCWLDKFKGSAPAWSDVELDSLWIGVRRHGKGNWDAMLRDPRLHFSVWRVAKDLAEQWDEEQSKLLSGMLIQPASFRNTQGHTQGINSGLLSETRVAGNQYDSHGIGNCIPPRSQALMDETQLSLGNVYVQRERSYSYDLPSQYTVAENNSSDKVSSVFNSDLRNMVLQKTSNKQLQKNIRGQMNRTYPNRKRLRYHTDVSNFNQSPSDKSGSHDGEVGATSNHSLLAYHPPAGSSVKGNLPHWLREVISLPPPRPTEPALPHHDSQVNLLYDDHQQVIPPVCSPSELPLPQTNPHQGLRKNEINCKFDGHATSDIPLTTLCSMGSRFGHLSMMGSSSIMPEAENQISKDRTDLNPACSLSISKTKDLIVIGSDASSEETISDDKSGQP
ncbi:protein CHROMATIN REMODELING 4-like [Telopea speciosissima]|uniref:protein CHROMATIN REMODELING 4-like n=1 Tax=Telopea speciosissima TaxID=54955 RepID=UPI001CC4699C|nr:protein CHROMATIN REMODELING 4-like [Telopea speciosissima]